MISDTLIQLINQYGYLVFFLALCLGPFGIPIPNEILILSGSMWSINGALNPWIVYFAILSGLLTAITLGYFSGKFLGGKFRMKFHKNHYFQKAEALFQRNGNRAMCLGILFPVIRYMMPIIVGFSGVPYRKFALITYSSAMVWSATIFALGSFLGDYILKLLALIDLKWIAIAIVGAAFVVVTIKLKAKLIPS
ncbi:DedA family protein [Paenibacillus sinopodophylli]|uniref:DedA family protein n=1 Tax=Paenibacillus sinopodophylli TaxID=1837342 RepID=UPI00110D083B|nr:DedA family protein [Paenibacillus sinopodophylli]